MKTGQRIELISMDDPHPVPAGTRGTVIDSRPVDFGGGDKWTQVDVEWDNGRSLMLSMPPDRVRVLQEGE